MGEPGGRLERRHVERDPLAEHRATIMRRRVERDTAQGMQPGEIEKDLRHLARALQAMHGSMVEHMAREAEADAISSQ